MYHCSIKIISRSGGKSAVASSAYRSGEKLEDRETGITHDYTNKSGVIYNEVMLPDHAPKEYKDRATLWNEVEKVEKQSNSQLAREVEVALPKEFSREQQIAIVQNYVKENFVKEGMCADWALHDKGDGNPHAHIMLTTRPIKENGDWGQKEKKDFARDEQGQKIPVIDPITNQQKVRVRAGKGEEKLWERVTVKANDWNDQSRAEDWRANWANECNKHLSQDKQLDHRSYERQEKEQIPTIHEGYQARQMEKDGKVSDLCQTNRDIKEYNNLNQELSRLGALRQVLLQQLENIKEKAKEAINERLQRLRATRTTDEPAGRNADGNKPTENRSAEERLASLQSSGQSRGNEQTIGELLRGARKQLQTTDTRTDSQDRGIDTDRTDLAISELKARETDRTIARTNERRAETQNPFRETKPRNKPSQVQER